MRIFIITRPKKRIQELLILFRQPPKFYDRSSPQPRGPFVKTALRIFSYEYLHYSNPVKAAQEPSPYAPGAFKETLTNPSVYFHKILL